MISSKPAVVSIVSLLASKVVFPGNSLLYKHNYRPQLSCGKIMFLHLSVILSTGGGVYAQGGVSQHSLGQAPPGRHTPVQAPSLGRHPPAQWILGYTHPAQCNTPWRKLERHWRFYQNICKIWKWCRFLFMKESNVVTETIGFSHICWGQRKIQTCMK